VLQVAHAGQTAADPVQRQSAVAASLTVLLSSARCTVCRKCVSTRFSTAVLTAGKSDKDAPVLHTTLRVLVTDFATLLVTTHPPAPWSTPQTPAPGWLQRGSPQL
jgi:hypothetical protein